MEAKQEAQACEAREEGSDMDMMLHERLREAEGIGDLQYIVGCESNEEYEIYTALANEIERYYIPRPRFKDGEPVSKGCEVDGGIVDGWCVWDDGAFSLNDEEGNTLQEADPGEFAKRPTPKVYDADGVETKAGDMGFDVANGRPLEVVGINGDDEYCLQVRYPNITQTFHIMPERFTHQEPDSLEKLRDDVCKMLYEWNACTDPAEAIERRFTALIERGA